MENLVVGLSRYIIIILMAIYTLYCFTAFRNNNIDRKKRLFNQQRIIMFVIHFICNLLLFINTRSIKIIFLYGAELVFFILTLFLFSIVYKRLSKLILNNMCMLIMIGFVMLTRLSYDKAIRQFVITVVSVGICLVIPFIIDRLRILERLGYIYALVGIGLLISVLIFGIKNYGATNWLSIFGIAIQPSEFVKIIFVFAIASLFSKRTDFIHVIKVTILAALHVLILVFEKDLGGALILFVVYLMMLYVVTKQPLYFAGGAVAGIIASVIAYRLFAHVRVRVAAWNDPFSIIDNEGYQITQSLFAIGTGGWFGMGLSKGMPESIPVVDKDFIFSAISEEFGAVFAICLMFIYLSCFIMFVNIAMKLNKVFYKYLALGLSVTYGFQVFLMIGGVTKFIPSTGVTLPLISYGGSSILSTLIIFSIIQGLYVLNKNEDVISN